MQQKKITKHCEKSAEFGWEYFFLGVTLNLVQRFTQSLVNFLLH